MQWKCMTSSTDGYALTDAFQFAMLDLDDCNQ